ncbi:hypothetical protein LX32DRAFT_412258 [Colletotrichum zoysiae]|uniref:Uncharacterized protein n=1 Tax=Colletotrichum zoysiae TaxID=1216348 RepID=A0AAD9HFA3_9PEZI|nr:hypothetical protein LX32DRAFT_412258 [Colletotrichum zoysiae]
MAGLLLLLLLLLLLASLCSIHAPGISPKRTVHSSLRLRTCLPHHHIPSRPRPVYFSLPPPPKKSLRVQASPLSPTPGFLAWAAATGCECTSYVAIDPTMQKETASVDPKPPTDPFARPYLVKSERRNQSERRPNEVPPTTPGNAEKR